AGCAVRDRPPGARLHRRRTGQPGPHVRAVVGGTGAGPGPAAGRHRRLAGRRGISPRGIPAAAARLVVQGDDPAITGELPEERVRLPGPTRTGRVGPVTAG